MTTEEAVDAIDDLISMIDGDVPDAAWHKAASFFENVRASAVEMQTSIELADNVTGPQQTAIENWEKGVRKWIR